MKDHIDEYTLTTTDNELYCYSNEFHSHLPFDRSCLYQGPLIIYCTGGGDEEKLYIYNIFLRQVEFLKSPTTGKTRTYILEPPPPPPPPLDSSSYLEKQK